MKNPSHEPENRHKVRTTLIHNIWIENNKNNGLGNGETRKEKPFEIDPDGSDIF